VKWQSFFGRFFELAEPLVVFSSPRRIEEERLTKPFKVLLVALFLALGSGRITTPSQSRHPARDSIKKPEFAESNPKNEDSMSQKTQAGATNQPGSEQTLGINQRIVREGVSVELSILPPMRPTESPAGLVPEGTAVFRLSIHDEATGNPVTGSHPAAWMDARAQEEPTDPAVCSKKVSSFLSPGPLGTRALDLNTYYVVTLNQDPTISVIDPRFGYGGSRLLAMLALKSPGEDWIASPDQAKLFVSMPESDQVAVADTITWNVTTNINVGHSPSRLALQPDGHYLWAAYNGPANDPANSGVSVISIDNLKVAVNIRTGRGKHDIAFTDDNRYCLVTNDDDDNVSIIDIRTLAKVKDLHTGRKPVSIVWSRLSKLAYIANVGDGTIAGTGVDGTIAIARAEPGIERIKIVPNGRYCVVVNPHRDFIHVLDVSTNHIVQSLRINGAPDQVTFSNNLAYVRRKNSETIATIPLALIGEENKELSAAEFPAGQHALGTQKSSLADSIVQARGESAVLIANPADKFVYFYSEGMAAPMGSFSDYGHQPRAVLVLDRSLKESKPGIYETVARLGGSGIFDLAVLLDSPRIVHCFPIRIGSDQNRAAKQDDEVNVEPLLKDNRVRPGQPINLSFRLSKKTTGQPHLDISDVQVLIFLAPGVWQQRMIAKTNGEGIYSVNTTLPQRGIYYVYIGSESLGLKLNNQKYLVLNATEGGATER